MKNTTTPLLALAALAGGGYWLATRGNKPKPLTATPPTKSGRVWNTRLVSNTGTGTNQRIVIELWAPSGLFGNPAPVHAVTYQQHGADRSKRYIMTRGPLVTAAMLDAAGKDFGIKKAVATA